MGKVKDFFVRLDGCQRRSDAKVSHTDEWHTCSTCGTHFQGRYCPQCGMDSREVRFSIRGVWESFISVFDFADRSIPRTMRDLFWRPGYMISEYLDGRRRIYFPPIKLVIVVSFLLAVTMHLLSVFGCRVEEPLWQDTFSIFTNTGESGAIWSADRPFDVKASERINGVLQWADQNRAYSLILGSLLWVVAMWLTLKIGAKKAERRYNLAEIFMAEMYVISQLQIATIVYMCIASILPHGVTVMASLPVLFLVILRFYDYWQLYRHGVWGTLWRMALAFLIEVAGVVIFMGMTIGIMLIVKLNN